MQSRGIFWRNPRRSFWRNCWTNVLVVLFGVTVFGAQTQKNVSERMPEELFETTLHGIFGNFGRNPTKNFHVPYVWL